MRRLLRFLLFYVPYIATLLILGSFVLEGVWAKVIYYMGYMSVCSTFIPLPTSPVVMVMGRFFSPLIVSLVGAFGTATANLLDYAILSTVAKTRLAERTKGTYLYQFWMKLYRKVPFLALTLTNFLPIPVDFIRFISIFERYNRVWYFLASYTGRFLRYLLLAWLGFVLPVSLPVLIVIGALFFLPGLVPVVRRMIKRKNE